MPPLDPPFDDEYVPETWITPPPRPGAAPPGTEQPQPPTTVHRRPGGMATPVAVPAPAKAHTRSTPPQPVRPVPEARTRSAPAQATRSTPAQPARSAPPQPARSAPATLTRAAGRATGPGVHPEPAHGRASTLPPAPAALAGATPEAKQAAKRFLDTCLEIVNGYRPAGHVRALASPPDAAGMVAQLTSAASRVSGRRRPGQPVRTVRLRRLRVCEPRPGVVEAAAAVGVAGRTWAMAFRIERRRGSWVGTSVALL
ncbi:Rv3235 family protein [Plantactinospora endophytica]|uniref:Rv3235 family protein n=1 Tax=Plantactinospora endophytica TaxID=673535 RepID=UPI001EF2040A|nr:Rv3235 family protein [Plantactinospora endophytica]